jgi:hypothetical protein
MDHDAPKLGILWRGDAAARSAVTPQNNRLHRIFESLAARGLRVEPVVYSEETEEEVRKQLLDLDGVLVWVNPIHEDDRDRTHLDALLRDASALGVWVSTHPDVILKIGTKQVLWDTRHFGWGSDTHLYRTHAELVQALPQRLRSGSRVLKQHRGNGGTGVWKVEWLAHGTEREPSITSSVRILHAERGSEPEEMPLGDFLSRCSEYFVGTGRMVDQAFQERLPDGMIRCYLAQDRVAGFAHQFIRALMPPPPPGSPPEAAQPGPRIMYGADAAGFERLREHMESDWVPMLAERFEIERDDLPVIWDADFLYGPKNSAGEDTVVLCEINVSCVFPFPDEALPKLARGVVERLRSVRARLR